MAARCTASGLRDVYITACGAYLPGPAIGNDEVETYLGVIDGKPSRLKSKILKSNGITTRHYALDREGRTTELNEQLCAQAVERALRARRISLSQVELLALGTTLGDALLPGFASMVHGRLCGPPMEVLSAGGVCCSSMAALQAAYRALRSDTRRIAVAGGSELVSRNLRASRMASADKGDGRDFGSEFLRWMLSDGAGAVVLEQAPKDHGLSLRIDWMELVSYAGDTPPCMYAGLEQPNGVRAGSTWLDHPTLADAERAGLLRIRQDVRTLDRLIEVGVEQWLERVRSGHIVTAELDHVVCHYSSLLLGERLIEELSRAEILPPRDKWFSNLATKGNTGSAAAFIALEELYESGKLRDGERILLVVPESGRRSVCLAHLSVVSAASGRDQKGASDRAAPLRTRRTHTLVGPRSASPIEGALATSATTPSPLATDDSGRRGPLYRSLVLELALVWSEFSNMLRQVPMIQRIERGEVKLADYMRLIKHLRQQVVDGSAWIARAASHTSPELHWLRSMMIRHAAEEHRDYQLLEQDYVAIGGAREDIAGGSKNVGSEALSAFIFQRASLPNPVDLAGSMFVIEGLGLRAAGRWADQLAQALSLREDQVSFLRYHSGRDQSHTQVLEQVLERLDLTEPLCERIVRTARVTARLYVLQLEELDCD